MNLSLFQYLLESTLGLAFFWGGYQLVGKSWLSVLGRRYYLILTPMLGLIIPLWDLSVLKVWDTPVVSGNWKDFWQWGIPYMEFNALTILSIVYFAGVCLLAFSLVDRLGNTWKRLKQGTGQTAWQGFRYRDFPFLAALFHYHFDDPRQALHPGPRLQLWFRDLRIWHVVEVLCLEIGIALFWFQPFLYAFRKELHTQNRNVLERHSLAETASPVHPWRWGSLILITAALPLYLFAADGICRLPMGSELESWGYRLQGQLQTPLWSFGSKRVEQGVLNWGVQRIALFPESIKEPYRYRPTQLTGFEYFLASDKLWRLQFGRRQHDIQAWEAILVRADGTVEVFDNEQSTYEHLQRNSNQREFTLYLKIQDEEDRTWLGILGVTDSGKAYGTDALGQLTDKVTLTKWHRFAPSPWLIDLRPDSPYRLRWGPIEAPLIQYANPDMYNGFFELTVQQAQQLTEAPIEFYYRDTLLTAEEISLYRQGKRWDRVSYRVDIDGRWARVGSGQDFASQLVPGNEFQLYARLPEIRLNQFYLRIIDPKGDYQPIVELPRPRIPDTTFSFQLLDRRDFTSVVKLDTTHAPTRKIHDLYRTYPKYRIEHVPGFKTYRRLVSYDEKGLELIGQSELPPTAFFAGDQLPEFLDFPGQSVQLKWGELFAAPDSEVYGLDEFRESLSHTPFLQVGDRAYRLVHAVAYIVRDRDAEAVVLLNEELFADWSAPARLQEMPSHRTVFLQELILEDGTGQQLVFPQSFAIHVGKPASQQSWQIEWEERVSSDSPSIERDTNRLSFQSYRLSELIAYLSGRPPNRIEFSGNARDPVLDLTLSTEDTLPKRAEDYVLRYLKKQYRLVFDYGRLDFPNRRLQVLDSDLLEKAFYDNPAPPLEKVRVFDHESTHLLTGVTLEELARYLEDHFGLIFDWYPHPYQDRRFIFRLDLAHLEWLPAQLESEYGISVSEADWIWDGMRVEFME